MNRMEEYIADWFNNNLQDDEEEMFEDAMDELLTEQVGNLCDYIKSALKSKLRSEVCYESIIEEKVEQKVKQIIEDMTY